MRRRSALLAAGLLPLAVGGLVAVQTPGASGSAAPRSLAQVLGERHGVAAGDPVWRAPAHAPVGPSAKGVDSGAKDQAVDVRPGPARAVTPQQLLSPGDRSGACTIGYGRGSVCLPTTPPSAGDHGMTVEQMPWTCAEVRTLLPGGVVLNARGQDPARLDSDGDGTACGAGDR